MSEVCGVCCYGMRGRYTRGYVDKRLDWCFEQSKKPDFSDRICDEVFRRGILVVRTHCVGDFYSPAYTRKWIEIATRCPAVKFFAYSRSWLVPTIRPLLFALGAMPNFRLWLSTDSAMGLPKDVPPGIRGAWLQHDEAQPPAVDLVFRVQKLRKKPKNGLPVCEHETVEGRAKGINCSSCRLCWN